MCLELTDDETPAGRVHLERPGNGWNLLFGPWGGRVGPQSPRGREWRASVLVRRTAGERGEGLVSSELWQLWELPGMTVVAALVASQKLR